MLLLNQFDTQQFKNIEERKKCRLCDSSSEGRLFKFFSHSGKLKHFVCKRCRKKLGNAKIQGILENFPLFQNDVPGFGNRKKRDLSVSDFL